MKNTCSLSTVKLTKQPILTSAYFGALINKDDQGPLEFTQIYVTNTVLIALIQRVSQVLSPNFTRTHAAFFKDENFDALFKEDISSSYSDSKDQCTALDKTLDYNITKEALVSPKER